MLLFAPGTGALPDNNAETNPTTVELSQERRGRELLETAVWRLYGGHIRVILTICLFPLNDIRINVKYKYEIEEVHVRFGSQIMLNGLATKKKKLTWTLDQ